MQILIPSILIALATAIAPPLRATAQIPDQIIINGKTRALTTNPLEQYFKIHPEKRPPSECMSTACWRGYVATWEISGNEFVLQAVDIEVPDKKSKKGEFKTLRRNVIGSVFPNTSEVVATWYSGTLILPEGELVQYVHMGYGSTYERYQLITIQQGIVVKQLRLSAEAFNTYRRQQFEAFKKTDEYKSLAASLKKEGDADASLEGFLFQFEAENYLSRDFSKEQLR